MNQGYSAPEIAKLKGCHYSTIYLRMYEYNIPRRKCKKIDNEIIDKLLRKHLSVKEIATKLNCSVNIVYNRAHIVLKELPAKHKIKDSIAILKYLFEKEELSITQVSKFLKLTPSYLYQKCKEYNIKHTNSKIDVKYVQKMINEKYTIKEIAKNIGCNITDLVKILKKYGVQYTKFRTKPQKHTLKEINEILQVNPSLLQSLGVNIRNDKNLIKILTESNIHISIKNIPDIKKIIIKCLNDLITKGNKFRL